MKTMIVVLLSVVLAGCATYPDAMNRDEFIDTTQRTYEEITEREFYQAAERLFVLSDGDDTSFSYPGEHAMIVQRNWSMYMVLAASRGTHVWQIATEPTDSGVNANAYVSLNSSTAGGMVTPNDVGYATSFGAMQSIVNTPAIYELFWARMDYLLGKSEAWPTCDDWNEKLKKGEAYGHIEPLCLAANTDDLLPDDLM